MKIYNRINLRLFLLIFSICIGNSMIAQIIEVKSIICSGDSTGQLGVYTNFGTGPYTYLWNNGKTTQSIDGLKAGNYSVTVTDALSATQAFSFTLNNPPVLNTSFTIVPNSTWPVNNGSITINATGGSGWYKYSVYDSLAHIEMNQPTPLFSKLASGTYFINTTDLYGCSKKDTVKVSENSALAVAMSIDTTACYRSTAPTSVQPDINVDSTLSYPIVVTFDYTQSYTIIDSAMRPGPLYVMDNITDTLPAVSGSFVPGFHIATVSTKDGRGFRYSWTVDSVVAPISIAWTQNNITCFGAATGSINALAQGSWMGYSYSISGPGYSGASASASGLIAGKFNIVATDFTGCSLTQSVTITQPDEPLHVVFNDPKDASCVAAKNGSVSVNRVDGSLNPLAYAWSNGENTRSIDSLFTGKYFITVTDANNCMTMDSIFVDAGKGATGIVFFDPMNVSCLAAHNGHAEINRVDGATAPLVYSWSNGKTTAEIDSVFAGTYSVTVTDKNNCSIIDSVVVAVNDDPFQIFFDIPVNTRCPYANDGSLNIHRIDGFSEPVIYKWSNGESTSAIDSLSMGLYSVTITDANTCVAKDSIEVKSEKESCIYNVVTPNGDGYNDYFDITDLCMGMSKKADIFNESGKLVASLNDGNLRWDGIDPSDPPTGPSSNYTAFIEVYKNGKLYKRWSETISVIYSK